MITSLISCFFFFFNDTATTEIYTLSLHDALPILEAPLGVAGALIHPQVLVRPELVQVGEASVRLLEREPSFDADHRSEEHTSELQSRQYLVCRLLLEKKKKTKNYSIYSTKLFSI